MVLYGPIANNWFTYAYLKQTKGEQRAPCRICGEKIKPGYIYIMHSKDNRFGTTYHYFHWKCYVRDFENIKQELMEHFGVTEDELLEM